MKQRGSALIISMMLIATVGAAAFGIARLLYADTSIASTYENGTIAYYAAESGIEEGFLRYKYNMNAEVPLATWTLGDNKVFRTNLSDASVEKGTSDAGITIANLLALNTSAKQLYDLRMGYIGTFGGPFYGQDGSGDGRLMDSTFSAAPTYGTGDYSFLRIPKDEALKIDLSGLDFDAIPSDTNALDFGLKFITDNENTFASTPAGKLNACKALAELNLTVKYSTGIVKEYKGLLSVNLTDYGPTAFNCESVTGIPKSKVFPATVNSYNDGNAPTSENYKMYYLERYRLQDLIIEAGGVLPQTDENVMFSVKPLNYDAAIALTINNCGVAGFTCNNKTKVVAGPYSYITSTGYYGGTTRTLTANIDRQSGTLYDLYDYVLFKGN